MKKLISIALFAAIVLGSVQVGATGVLWSKSSLSEGEVVATFTGLDAGDRVAVGVYSDGVFSKMDMKYAENENEELSLVITNEEDMVRAFVWEQDSMRPKYVGSSYLTESGIKDENALFSDNQMINNVNAVGYKTIEALKDDYQITFNLTVAEKGDNAIILGDSANGTIGYGEASAILQFNGDNFTTRRGDGAGNYSENAVTICPVSLGIAYTVTIQGNVSTNTYMIKIYDGEQTYTSPMMTARTDATAGIDTDAVSPRADLPQALPDFIAHLNERPGTLFKEQAGGCERNAFAGAEKELRTQIFLQRADLMQHGAGGQKKEVCCLGEAAAVTDS